MKVENYFSSNPEHAEEILRHTLFLKNSGLESPSATNYPGGWNTPYLDESIWDERLFSEKDGPSKGWGMIDVGYVVHPALYNLIGQLLGIEKQEVRNIAWWQSTYQEGGLVGLSNIDNRPSGGRLLKDMLSAIPQPGFLEKLGVEASDLVFSLVAVPPLKDRLPIAAPGGVQRPSELSVLLNHLAWKTPLGNSNLEEESYGWLMERNAVLGIQVIFERLVHQVESAQGCGRWETEQLWVNQLPVGPEGSWQPEDMGQDFPEVITPDMVPEEWEEEDLGDRHAVRNVPLRLLDAENGSLWIQFPNRLTRFDLVESKVVQEIETLGELLGKTKTGKLAYRLHGQLSLLDVETGKWVLDHSGEGFIYREDTESERATLVNFSTYQSLRLLEVLDYPICGVMDASGKYIWVEDKERQGGVYELETGCLVLSPGTFAFHDEPLFLNREGALIVLSRAAMEIMEETLADAVEGFREMDIVSSMEQAAFCIRNNRWWFFAFNSLWIQGQETWRIDKAITAAGFSNDGTQLFLSNDKELRVLLLDPEGVPLKSTTIPLGLVTSP